MRDAARADLEGIVDLLVCSGQNWTTTSVQGQLDRPQGVNLVMDEAGAVQAAVLGWISHDVAEIAMIAVHPALRRRGVARALLDGWEREVRSRGARTIWLEVRPSNTPALRLYEGAGYKTTGRRPRYYHDGEDAILMERGLAREGT